MPIALRQCNTNCDNVKHKRTCINTEHAACYFIMRTIQLRGIKVQVCVLVYAFPTEQAYIYIPEKEEILVDANLSALPFLKGKK